MDKRYVKIDSVRRLVSHRCAGVLGSPDSIVMEIAHRLLEPETLEKHLLRRYIRKAKRLGIYWAVLNVLERAVLEAALLVRKRSYKSRKLLAILSRLVAKIELYTVKGKVLLRGLSRALSRYPHVLEGGFYGILCWARKKLSYLLYLGRSLLEVEAYFKGLTV